MFTIQRYWHLEATFHGSQEIRSRLFQVCFTRGIVINCFTSWREIVIDSCRGVDDVVTVWREMFGRHAAASYFRWHVGILVLSTDVKLIVRTVGITSISSSFVVALGYNNNICLLHSRIEYFKEYFEGWFISKITSDVRCNLPKDIRLINFFINFQLQVTLHISEQHLIRRDN